MKNKFYLLLVVCLTVFTLFINLSFADELMEKQAVEYLKEGIEAQKSGEIDRAVSLYTKAVYSNPKYTKAYNNLGAAYAQKGNLEKAEQMYREAVSIDENYAIAWKNLAIIYAERKDFNKFYEYWKKGQSLDLYSPFIIDDEVKSKR